MQLSEDNRPILRFSLFSAWWSNKQSAIEHYFPEELPKLSTPWVQFGAKVANALETGEDWVAHLQRPDYDQQEYRLIEEFEEVPDVLIRGSLDRYSTELHAIIDDKCCKNKSSATKSQYQRQLLFYQVLIEQKHDWVQETSHINWIPVAMDDNGLVRLTGDEPVLIPYTFTKQDRDEMRKLIVDTAKDIKICHDAFIRGDIKI